MIAFCVETPSTNKTKSFEMKLWICCQKQSSSISSSCFISSFSLSADVLARSSSDWGRQTDQHALAVFCLCNNMSVTMKPHSACLPLCVLKASIWVICTNKAINLSLFLFCLCVCSQIVVECERAERGKEKSEFPIWQGGFLCLSTGVFSCMWVCGYDPQQWRVVDCWIFNFHLMFTQFPL